MGFFAGSVDLTSPGPIGSTTPNTGKFTTLTLAPSANTTPFTASGYSLTGTNAQSFFDLSGTWNTTGTPTAFKLNVTDTASNASSLLMDLQVGGTSQFSIKKDGKLSIFSNGLANDPSIRFISSGGPSGAGIYYASPAVVISHYFNAQIGLDEGANVRVHQNGSFAFTSNSSPLGTMDTILKRDASNTLALRNSTNAQTFRLYNTYTDASNYERGFFRWNTNVLEIGAEAAGTGTQRQLRLPLGTVTASTPLSVTQTWNSAGVTFTGIQANITDTASASGSLLMDLQVNGISKLSVDRNGSVSCSGFSTGGAGLFSTAFFRVRSTGAFTFSASSNPDGSQDITLNRDSAGVLAQRAGTTSQAFRIYRTYTDASNYERLGLLTTNTTRYTITSENAGTGSARSLEVSFYTSAADPTSTDITSGCFSVWKNSGTGTIKLWANDSGTMKSVALA